MPDRSADPLESVLRLALQDEAARTEIVVDVATVEARWRARQTTVDRRRRLLAAVATIAVVVIGSLVVFRPGPLGEVAGSPAASVAIGPSAQPLPSIETPPGTVIDAGDTPANAMATGPIDIGIIDQIGLVYTFFVACQGPGTLSITSSGIIEPPLTPVPCDGAIATRDLSLNTDEALTLFVTREPDTRWHVVVLSYELANPSPSLAPREHLATAPDGVPRTDTAVVVREDAADAIEVVAVAADGVERSVATIPRGKLPEGTVVLDQTDVSDLGWLAIPISTDATDAAGVIAVVDLYDPTAPAWIIDGVEALDARSMGWSRDAVLAYIGQDGRPALAYPATQTTTNGPFAPNMTVPASPSGDSLVWTDDGFGLLAQTTDSLQPKVGAVDMRDGTFRSPGLPVYQATGRGRVVAADGSTLSWVCPAGFGSRCSVSWGAAGANYPETPSGPSLIDSAFDARGIGVWVITGRADGTASLVHATAPHAASEVAQLALEGWDPRATPGPAVQTPRFSGLSADDAMIAIEDGDRTLIVDTETTTQRDLDGSFAGWEAGATYPWP